MLDLGMKEILLKHGKPSNKVEMPYIDENAGIDIKN
jgi:hypothetical protein